MSIRLMSQVFDLEGPKGAHRLVLLALADNANDEGYCWPAVSTIARKAGMDVRRTQRVIRELVDMGLISITYRPGPDGKNLTNVYQLTLEGNPAPEEPKAEEKAEGMGGAGATHRMAPVPPTGGAGATHRVARVPPESSIKPSINHQELVVVVEAPSEKFSRICRIYEQEIGPLTGFIGQEVEDLIATYPEEWIVMAFKGAASQNKRSMAYVKGILKNYRAAGIGPGSRNLPSGHAAPNGNDAPAKRAVGAAKPETTSGQTLAELIEEIARS